MKTPRYTQRSGPLGWFIPFVASLFLFVSVAQAQTGALGGRVTDAATNAPLAGALVTVVGTSIETSTDRSGEYALPVVPAGVHTVRVSYLGMADAEGNATVTSGGRATLDLRVGGDVVRLTEYRVEGQREGQARALNQQRASDNLRSIVSADAAGRFPDQNVAETMQRITGVSLQRDQGEGRFISIRGVDPDLNNTQLNGVNLPASEEDTRKVNLDVFPTDILDSVEVVKAVTPDMDGDAIGGSVNIKTLTAFSQAGRVLRGTAEGQYSNLSGKWGHKLSAVWGDTFNDGKVGLLVAISDAKRYFGSDDRETDGNPWVPDASATPGVSFLTPGGDIQHREYIVNRVRRGLNASLDFRPSADDSYFVRAVYSHFSDYENRFRTRFRGRPQNALPTSDTTGTITGRPVVIDLKDRTEDNNVFVFSAGGENIRNAFEIDYQVSFARAELDDPFRYQPAFSSANTTWNYDFADMQKPVITGTGASLPASAFNFTGWALDQGLNTEDEISASLNVKRTIEWGGNPGFVKVGAKHRAKSRSVDIESKAVRLAPGRTLTLAQVARTSSRGVTPTFPSVDPAAFRAYHAANPDHFVTLANETLVNGTIEDYETDENVSAAYAMGSVRVGKLTLIGGARYESTRFRTRGWSIEDEDPSTLERTSARRTYDNFLPSVVGRYDFSQRLVGRASWTRTLARPKFLDSSSSRIIEDDDVFQGNSNLKPYSADNWDASLEFYPKSLGVISVGAFHKDIKDFIFSQVIAGAGIDGGSLTTPLNGKSATVTGFEADWQQQFSFLPAPFDGFGFYANLTLTDSESVLGGARSADKIPFLNQSKRLTNVALSYEKHGFFIRLSMAQRTRYLNSIGASTVADIYVEDHTQFDLSTNYRISPRYTVYAEVLNLTNEPFSAVYNVTNGLQKAEFYKWSANVGVKLNF
jgi:TonB-dependent receptor